MVSVRFFSEFWSTPRRTRSVFERKCVVSCGRFVCSEVLHREKLCDLLWLYIKIDMFLMFYASFFFWVQ